MDVAAERTASVLSRWLVAQARGTVLDVGCGDGDTAILCAQRGLRTLGVDARPEAVQLARERRSQELAPVQELLSFQVADARQLAIPDAAFETVLLGEVIEEQRDAAPILAEAVRVLCANGVLAITTPFGYTPRRGHRVTFYVTSLIELVGQFATVESFEIGNAYFRVVARPGRMPVEDRMRLAADVQPTFERVLLQVQRNAYDYRTKLSRRVREAVYREQVAEWKYDTLRQQRWSRLGESLTHARGWRGVMTLPQGVRQALRSVPVPDEPVAPTVGKIARPPLLPVAERKTVERPDAAGHYCSVDLPAAVPLPDGPVVREGLRAATILDVFSERAFSYEWSQVLPGPDDWREVMERERADLLFVESAWWGNDGRWRELLYGPSGPSEPLRELVKWCQHRGIPTVWWNKEDPPHFRRFIETAKLFDHVFTVDADSLERYRQVLGHDRIGQVSFAAQPRIHNPTAVPGGRRYNVAFAGTYFTHKYRERAAQMATVVDPAREFGLHILSRVTDNVRCQFPAAYAEHVVGSLPYEQMLAAYKAYKIFLNVNSVTTSRTMCARRVFELSACSTAVVSAYSPALEPVFGDRIRISRSREDTTQALRDLLGDDELREREAHRAMRAVFASHTYGHRVDTVLNAVGLSSTRPSPTVSVIAIVDDADQLLTVADQVATQIHRPTQLVIVLRTSGLEVAIAEEKARAVGVDDVVARLGDSSSSLGAGLRLGVEAADGYYVALFGVGQRYGANYLSDLLATFTYTRAGIVGKGAYYVHTPASGETMLHGADLEYAPTEQIHGATTVFDREALRNLRFPDQSVGVVKELLIRAQRERIGIYSADRFNFACIRGCMPPAHQHRFDLEEHLGEGRRVVFHGDLESEVFF